MVHYGVQCNIYMLQLKNNLWDVYVNYLHTPTQLTWPLVLHAGKTHGTHTVFFSPYIQSVISAIGQFGTFHHVY